MKRFLIILMILALFGCSSTEGLKITALKGPTSMGMVYTSQAATMELVSSPDEIIGKITSGEVDLAMLPLNMASILYNKTQGDIRLLAINTSGNLFLCGEPLGSLEELEGKSLLSAGQNATPMYVLELLLEGLDLELDYLPSHGDIVAAASEGLADYYVLPEPFVSLYKNKVGGEVALDLAESYREKTGQPLTMGALVTTGSKLEEKKKEIKAFLDDYKESIERVVADPEGAAELIEKYGIVETRELAQGAIPGSGLVFMTPGEARGAIELYFDLLMESNPKALGGEYPGEDFYADF